MKVLIMNKEFEVSKLEEIAKKDNVVVEYLSDYKDHRNCRAYNYIAGEKISEIQKAAFIHEANSFLFQKFGVK